MDIGICEDGTIQMEYLNQEIVLPVIERTGS